MERMMQIEVGKKYLTRGGEVVEIVDFLKGASYPFFGDNKQSYTKIGSVYILDQSDYDLISEYHESTNTKCTVEQRETMVMHFVNNGHCAKSAVAEAEVVLAFIYGNTK